MLTDSVGVSVCGCQIDMAVSVSVFVGGGWRFMCRPMFQRVNQPNTPLFLQNQMSIRLNTTSTTRWWSCVVPRAQDPKTQDQNSNTSYTSSQEDLAYVAKLVVGSFAGAAAIKYGSAIFPEITTPNLVLALVFILTPVLVAVLLLIKESSQKP
ncbi:uncharacterized protein LOC133296343 [Gastrolobium bilobum]|uniref:uncharacterized protein LOC133296343 n=1 Tax=Gastrolobium bilobum TaxID=150636 RepID=UPI002AB190EA|nr:uncharacterized protein LOC133296343 [Gastrolobium bilobum]